MVADNLLSMTQNFVTPDFIQKFSSALGQPADKIQSGLKSVIPTFLMGLVNKGTTNEGAESLVNMVQKQNFDSNANASNLGDASYLQKGSDVVSGIFGNNLSSVASSLGTTTGMNSSSITKMMGMIAPMVMGVLGSKIKKENMSPSGLMYFLSQQKSVLSSFIPSGIAGFFGGAASSVSNLGTKFTEGFERKTAMPSDINTYSSTAGVIPTTTRSKPWGLMALVALAILAAIWFFGSRRSADVVSTSGIIPTTETTATSQAPTTVTESSTSAAMVEPGQRLDTLDAFLTSGTVRDLPKRFRFENLTFETGGTILATGSAGELDQIAATMKEHPMVTARLEGFTDNTGDINLNQELSARRAESVKQELVQRGVEANRLEAIGLGVASPIATNDDEAGRAQNRRIEFVVTGLE